MNPKPADQQRVPVATWIAVVILSVFWVGLGSLMVEHSREHDFVSFYVGSTLALEGNFSSLYDRDAQFARQKEAAPNKDQLVPYVRPPFYLVALAPLSLFSLHTSFWLWIAGHSLLLVACWLWASRRFGPDALIFGALYLPTALGIASGQDCVLMLAIGIGFYHLADRRKDFPAGAVLALGLLKFHLLLLLPLAMLLNKRWRMLAGYAITGSLLALSSIALIGFGGVKQYVSLLQAKDLQALLPSPELMINLNGLMANMRLESAFVLALLVVLVMGVAMIGARGAPLWRWLSVAVVSSLLITHHVYGYDAGIVLLPVWLTMFLSKSLFSRIAALILAAPLVFFAGMAGTPWSILPSLSLLAFLLALAVENYTEQRQAAPTDPSTAGLRGETTRCPPRPNRQR